jgi:hypothetical protein
LIPAPARLRTLEPFDIGILRETTSTRAVRPATVHELYLMGDDVKALAADMKAHNIGCGRVRNQAWGLLTHVTLPGGGKLGIYQPRHARPQTTRAGRAPGKATKRPTRESANKRDKKVSMKKASRR